MISGCDREFFLYTENALRSKLGPDRVICGRYYVLYRYHGSCDAHRKIAITSGLALL